jgi:hypothetical protein
MSDNALIDRILNLLADEPATGAQIVAAFPEHKPYFVRAILWEMVLSERVTLLSGLRIALPDAET